MSVNLNAGEDKLIPTEGYTDDIKADGSKVFTCKQCCKEIKTEQGDKAHIKNKHKNQPVKRTVPIDAKDKIQAAEENKKQKFGSLMSGQDVSDFDFDPYNIETSSQIEGSEHLDLTSDICAEYLQGKSIEREFEDHENTVDNIVASRSRASTNLINLDETLSADQDHNDLIEDDCKGNISEELCAVRATVVSLKADVCKLTEENTKFKEMITIKNEANDALTATVNSLNDVKNKLETKVKNLEVTKSKYETRLKTYGATIKEMDSEVKRLKAGKVTTADQSENNDKLKKVEELLTEKQREIKSLQSAVKKKDAVEKDLQITINSKNARIVLEVASSRHQIMYDHVKEIGDKQLKASEKIDTSKIKGTPSKHEKPPTKKCFYENNGNCRDQDKCLFVHPKKTCQSHSKLGSCPQESLCEHRHPQKVCPRLQATGYCSSGDRCRNRHPLEYAFNDYSLSSNPHSLQGPGADQAYPGARISLSSAPREPWSPPFQAAVGQEGPPLHPQFQQGRGDHNQLW